jgi:hypothetical protein
MRVKTNERIGLWLERIDPGVHRRIKGLRLVTAYGIAAMLGALLNSSYGVSGGSFLSYLAAGFGLWASVSEGQASRLLSTRDLVILNAAAVTGQGALLFFLRFRSSMGGWGRSGFSSPARFSLDISSDSESLVRALGLKSISASFWLMERGLREPIWQW